MKIEIEEAEIKEAIIDYVCKQGFTIDSSKATVDIKNARGEFGVTAAISVGAQSVQAVEPAKVEALVTETTGETEDVKDTKKLKFGNA